MMDFDEALELVTDGAIVSRPSWGPLDIVRPYTVEAPNGAIVTCWRSTRQISILDWNAEDWRVIGVLQ